ncbi:hypothetical protein LWI29_015692 [Acer saccharum]|uniref:Alpha/beta hydrolase fold-3 domain-containing protein n=1 Tax=Acer saccharum TaxID=4024 RepID=A0AA39RXH4_ACESA|nr:hypothetical protein LWI29_015692 [Acer saccharum]
MASNESEISQEFRFFRVYKDGRLEFFRPPCEKIPPSDDPITGVRSKDVTVSSEPPVVSTRIFIPKITKPNQKFPLLFYVHGGGFSMLSAFAKQYHDFCTTVSAQANVVVVSVEYGLFPDRPIPACYDDSWTALQWVASHVGGNGPEPWLNNHADFGRVFHWRRQCRREHFSHSGISGGFDRVTGREFGWGDFGASVFWWDRG